MDFIIYTLTEFIDEKDIVVPIMNEIIIGEYNDKSKEVAKRYIDEYDAFG